MTVAEIMEAVKELKVMELSELVKALEEEFGVSATPVAVAGAVAGGDGAAARWGYGYGGKGGHHAVRVCALRAGGSQQHHAKLRFGLYLQCPHR